MDETGAALGKYLSTIREAAQLTQAELAKKVTVSPTRISRIESGDVSLTEDEMDQLLREIGTAPAQELREYLDQEWQELERPPFEHPNRKALWLANGLLKKLRHLKSDPELKSVFLRHIEVYENELRTLAANLSATDHSVAFVGSIGVGKSTAICMMADLRVSKEGPLNKQVVLEAGAGGTTICEVHIKNGPGYGLIVQPRSDEAIRFDVADFAEYLLRLTKGAVSTEAGDSQEGPGVTKEINRAIRNMSGLAEVKRKDSTSGRVIRSDPARDLAVKYPEVKELVVQILSRMNLTLRDQRDVWYPQGTKLSPKAWLQQAFTEINNGRNSQFSLPERIEVIIPDAILQDKELGLRIVDTKGIDGAATRADLDKLFDDSRTLVVLCSRFNDAPESSLQQLLQRIKDAGARDIAVKTTVLALARPEEAEAVKDNSGLLVEDQSEGYDLKRADVEMHLSRLGLNEIPVEFFNARDDEASPLREFLLARVRSVRSVWGTRITALSKTVDELIVNQKQEQTAVVFRDVMRRLNTWLSKNREIDGIAEQAQQELIKAIQAAHWRSVWASIRRRGEWYNLDYYYQIGFGARTIAAKYVLKKAREFEVIIQNLLDDDDLSPAHDMLDQVKRVLRSSADELLKRMEIVGKTAFENDLRSDTAFWNELGNVSGLGYKDNIADTSKRWFKLNERLSKHVFVKDKIIESWQEILATLDQLIGSASKE
jgi:transcriptional regulator with XRE-family HTH domain